MRSSTPRALPAAHGVSLFCRSGLAQRDPADWFAAHRRDRSRRRARGTIRRRQHGARRGRRRGGDRRRMARRAGLRVFELNVGAPHASEATPGAIVQETDPARLGRAGGARARGDRGHGSFG